MSNKNYRFDSGKVYDTKNLYLCTGNATQQQVENIIMDIGQKLEIDSEFVINVVTTREGQHSGFGYGYVTNPDFYYALTGDNIDGSKRIIVKDDPNWNPPDITMEKALENFDMTNNPSINDDAEDWSLLMSLEDQREQIIKSYTCPKIEYQDESLVKKEWLRYTDNDNDINYISIHKAFVNDDDIEFNAMMSYSVPEWVTEGHIRESLRPYINGQVIRNGKFKGSLYPIIYTKEPKLDNPNDTRKLYVCFNPNNYDCAFIINMTKRIVIINPETNKPVVLIFKTIKNTAMYYKIESNNSESSPESEVSIIERPKSRNGYYHNNNNKERKHLSSSDSLPRARSSGNQRRKHKSKHVE